ncbi:Uncharacterised protein [Serratia ficaria]|nr:Uncharacterised protein [Serratia ficaria]
MMSKTTPRSVTLNLTLSLMNSSALISRQALKRVHL